MSRIESSHLWSAYDHSLIRDFHYYIHNTTAQELIWDLFEVDFYKEPQHSQDYLQKFIDARHTTELWALLDTVKQNKLVAAVREKYPVERVALPN